ncbi:helix-turn-helix transcriptional regulator [Comamonas testosteroni]|uniref:helix-turn-helix domain-containing protein n=1 Tax=Comamonas testosteroni TaxID=285 RepID=UPI0023AB37B7|nr:helix-turn-helix transcriptional regulator [Comamonas testosteroni]WEE79431.1 helix-turn-helix transcriptional regulator [Comamonas testosteroni]
MQNLKLIRERLGVTQQAMADGLGCTQSNIGHYEKGQNIPPAVARLLIQYAGGLGLVITFDHIYAAKELPELAQPDTSTDEVGRG